MKVAVVGAGSVGFTTALAWVSHQVGVVETDEALRKLEDHQGSLSHTCIAADVAEALPSGNGPAA